MVALNPNHPMTQSTADHWHKIAALILHKLGQREVVLSLEDIKAATTKSKDGMLCIVLQEKADGLHVRLVSEDEGRRLARENGGLPA